MAAGGFAVDGRITASVVITCIVAASSGLIFAFEIGISVLIASLSIPRESRQSAIYSPTVKRKANSRMLTWPNEKRPRHIPIDTLSSTIKGVSSFPSPIVVDYTHTAEVKQIIRTTMSTLTVPNQVPSVTEDCEQLRKAFSGWGTNEKLIISILAHRNATQRKLIRKAYSDIYGEDLLKALDKELSNDFERLVLLWTLDPAERDAFLANEMTKRRTSINQVLVEIACARSSNQLLQAKQAYHTFYKKSLEEDVAHHTTGDFRKLLLPLVSAYRYEGDEVNMTLAKSEAKMLHEKISNKAYNDEDVIGILSTRSKAQINATLNHYKNEFGNDINKDLKADPKDEFLALLRATVKCLINPEKYFEKVLRLSINRRGTDEQALTRVVTTRAEFDMKIIKEEYQKRNSVPLDHAIAKDTRGDYEEMLLALLGHEDA